MLKIKNGLMPYIETTNTKNPQIMKTKIVFLIFGISAVIVTLLGYFVDNDPPYADFKMTVSEFSVITLIFFGLFSAIYFATKFINRRF